MSDALIAGSGILGGGLLASFGGDFPRKLRRTYRGSRRHNVAPTWKGCLSSETIALNAKRFPITALSFVGHRCGNSRHDMPMNAQVSLFKNRILLLYRF
jgi:hypothetical protein